MSLRTKKRCKGAISIFLIIIFLSCYILTGLLVDGGRYRIAMVLAESGLDSAAASILSRYDKLVYDLYGLLATDDVSEEDLTNLFKQYVDDTLQIADIDYSQFSTLLSDTIRGGEPKEGFFDGYDFQVDIKSGSSVTLASTKNVEYQILEHMKYRAPLRVMNGSGNFLENINNLLNVKKRLEAATERIQVTKQHESKSLFKDCSKLIQKINQFDEEVLAFCHAPDQRKASIDNIDQKYAKECQDYIKDFDDKVGKVREEEEEEISKRIEEAKAEAEEDENEGEEGEGGGKTVDEDAIRQEVEAEFQPKYDVAVEELVVIFRNKIQVWAADLYGDANTLRDEVEEMNGRYEQYISDLQKKIDEHPGSEDYKTVFGPEIELAKSNCGEILKNMDIILTTRQYTQEMGVDDFAQQFGQELLEASAKSVVETLRGHDSEPYSKLEDKIRQDNLAHDYLEMMNEDLKSLWSVAGYFYPGHTQEVNVKNSGIDVSGNQISRDGDNQIRGKDETEKQTDKSGLESLIESDLEINFTQDALDNEFNGNLDNSLTTDTGNILETMNAGMSLIDRIGKALENARDSIYVDEYILMTFPNVVHHYNMDDADRKAKENEVVNHLLEGEYQKYNATLAEVEYILTGDPDTRKSVMRVEGRLLAVRTIFNMLSIFTDTAKVSQANTIAAAAGPFAPLASLLLLTAWAVAEAALDVSDLMHGEEVPLLKQSADWKISVEGAVKQVLREFANQVTDYIASKGDQYLERAEDQVNLMIYNAYNTVNEPLGQAQGILDDAKNGLRTWASYTDNCGVGAVNEANHALIGAVEEAQGKAGEIKTVWDTSKEHAVVTINRTFSEAKEKARGQIYSALSGISDTAADTIFGIMPLGQVVSGGNSMENSKLKFDYMDYMRVFLLFMDETVKVQRVQQLIQANIRHGGNEDFKMETCYSGVWADMDCSIKFLFMSEAIVPARIKQNGRMIFKIHTSQSY